MALLPRQSPAMICGMQWNVAAWGGGGEGGRRLARRQGRLAIRSVAQQQDAVSAGQSHIESFAQRTKLGELAFPPQPKIRLWRSTLVAM